MDQRPVERRDDVLVYTGAPLEEDLELTGPIEVKLFVSTSAPDTDFVARLCDVYPDGRSMLVCDGVVRARYRNSLSAPEPLEPGRVYELPIDLWSTSIVFNRGHCIRVDVSSSNYPRFDRNPNTGLPYREGGEVRVARNALCANWRRPSHLLLPVVE